MSPTPSRSTAAGRSYSDLWNLAKRQERGVAEYFVLYALEGFVARLGASKLADRLVLKGGLLMAALSGRRPTRDIDLSAAGLPSDIGEAEEIVRVITSVRIDDGLEFNERSIVGEALRDEGDYPGVRVHLVSNLATARVSFHVDINFGDPVWPAPTKIKLPRLLGGEIEILGYPVSMVLAEKIVTAVERGAANTRWRDFADIASISATTRISGAQVKKSTAIVADYRGVKLAPLAAILDGMASTAQPKWTTWRRNSNLKTQLLRTSRN